MWVPDEHDRKTTYSIVAGKDHTAFVYSPQPGSNEMKKQLVKAQNGKFTIDISETPCFFTFTEVQTQ